MLLVTLLVQLLLYALLLVGVFFVSIILYYQWSFQHWKRKGICYIEPSIPFGNLGNKFKDKKLSRMEELSKIYKELKRQGRRHCGIYQYAAPTYFVVDLELVKTICIKDFEHFVDRGLYYNERDDPIGVHIVATEGDRWKNMRSKLTTCFTSTKLKEMFDLLLECIEGYVAKIDEYIENKQLPVDNKTLSACLTTDCVGSCTLGIKCRSFTDPEKNFLKYGTKVLELDKRGQFRFLFGVLFPKLSRVLGVRQVEKGVSDFFYKVIWETVMSRRQKNIVRTDALQMLMSLNEDPLNGITKDDIVANSFALYIGGFETSSNTLNYCLFELATHKEYQEKARKEVLEVISNYNNQLTYESLNDMKFLKQCLDEVWRLYSPVHVVNRVCTKDWKVPGEEHVVVEKGTIVLIHITSIHRDPDYWERPDEFYPEHHEETKKSKRHPFAFIPFGEGKRKCLGERFGKMQMMGALATVLSRYRITLDEKTRLPLRYKPGAMVPVPLDGIWLRYDKLEEIS